MKINELFEKAFALTGRNDKRRLDLEVLLAYCIGESREYIFAHKDEDIDKFTGELFLTYVKRFLNGEPIAYMLGEKEFFGLKFFVDERVLIPRPETEMLVEKAINFINDNYRQKKFRVLDMGTGSGAIAVSLAKYFLDDEAVDLEVEAVDISEAALEVARVNGAYHQVDHKINFFCNDLFGGMEDILAYDVILANLPYIGEVENNFVEEGVKKYEPKAALFSGADGLDLYKKMFQQIKDENIDFKLFIGEFGESQGDLMRGLLSKNFEQDWKIEKDLAGLDRVFIITKK